MPSPITVPRPHEIERIFNALRGTHCVSLVGLSNTGKSTLLRMLRAPESRQRYQAMLGRAGAFVYVDCNSMLQVSGQGFYEVILRAIRESIPDLPPDIAGRIRDAYQQVIDPDTEFQVPLSFNTAMTALIDSGFSDLILLLDEFDEAFDALDGRVFLNLRALKDKYPDHIVYITATLRPLDARRNDDKTAEFLELTTGYTYHLKPMRREEADVLAKGLALHAGVPDELSEGELDFIWEQAGGLPRLLRAVVRHMVENFHYTDSGAPLGTDSESLLDLMHLDVTIRNECQNLWGQLPPVQREALTALASGGNGGAHGPALKELLERGLVSKSGSAYTIVSALFEDFLRRQQQVQEQIPDGLWIDHEAGDVWVNGQETEHLTELEFKLLTLLTERRNKLTDKFQIVETVWGVAYIDQVDDARIEKLVSRLRAKVEPDPGSPRFIHTVRGRGYRLVPEGQNGV